MTLNYVRDYRDFTFLKGLSLRKSSEFSPEYKGCYYSEIENFSELYNADNSKLILDVAVEIPVKKKTDKAFSFIISDDVDLYLPAFYLEEHKQGLKALVLWKKPEVVQYSKQSADKKSDMALKAKVEKLILLNTQTQEYVSDFVRGEWQKEREQEAVAKVEKEMKEKIQKLEAKNRSFMEKYAYYKGDLNIESAAEALKLARSACYSHLDFLKENGKYLKDLNKTKELTEAVLSHTKNILFEKSLLEVEKEKRTGVVNEKIQKLEQKQKKINKSLSVEKSKLASLQQKYQSFEKMALNKFKKTQKPLLEKKFPPAVVGEYFEIHTKTFFYKGKFEGVVRDHAKIGFFKVPVMDIPIGQRYRFDQVLYKLEIARKLTEELTMEKERLLKEHQGSKGFQKLMASVDRMTEELAHTKKEISNLKESL